MIMPLSVSRCKAASWLWLMIVPLAPAARAEWLRDDSSIAWRDGTNVAWRFSFDTNKGKPFFHPLSVGGGPALTNFKPEDHPWHYGLWFSWKYINHANYWEEDRATGRAEGMTRWSEPFITTKPDGGAEIGLNVRYHSNPTGYVDLNGLTTLTITTPETNGSYRIYWIAKFIAGKNGAFLDRTPMLGEPDGKVNGGYAGLGLRMASAPLTMSVVCSTGVVSRFENDRARPSAPAIACNFTDGGRDVGSIAIFSYPVNDGENAAWYLINSETMRFACPAVLASKPRTLKPGEVMWLRYVITVRREPWTPEALRASQPEWLRNGSSYGLGR